ncbi:MAG: hypothetical protein HZR80_02680 [Candidatus Heimdallarchaeota archaeon]
MGNILKTNEEKREPQLVPITERRNKLFSLTSFVSSLATAIIFFVGMPFLGTYFLHPYEEYKFVFLIIFLSILLAVSLVGLIFGVIAIRIRRNPYNLTGIIVNSFVLIANLGMTIFLIYIQLTHY